jgi:hypothetical protein
MTALLTHEGPKAWTTQPTGGRLRRVCHRIRLTIREMNYASRRTVERQAPWTVDRQWDRRQP